MRFKKTILLSLTLIAVVTIGVAGYFYKVCFYDYEVNYHATVITEQEYLIYSAVIDSEYFYPRSDTLYIEPLAGYDARVVMKNLNAKGSLLGVLNWIEQLRFPTIYHDGQIVQPITLVENFRFGRLESDKFSTFRPVVIMDPSEVKWVGLSPNVLSHHLSKVGFIDENNAAVVNVSQHSSVRTYLLEKTQNGWGVVDSKLLYSFIQ